MSDRWYTLHLTFAASDDAEASRVLPAVDLLTGPRCTALLTREEDWDAIDNIGGQR